MTQEMMYEKVKVEIIKETNKNGEKQPLRVNTQNVNI